MKMYEYCEEDIKAIRHDIFELYALCVPEHVGPGLIEPLIDDIFERLHNCSFYDSEEA